MLTTDDHDHVIRAIAERSELRSEREGSKCKISSLYPQNIRTNASLPDNYCYCIGNAYHAKGDREASSVA